MGGGVLFAVTVVEMVGFVFFTHLDNLKSLRGTGLIFKINSQIRKQRAENWFSDAKGWCYTTEWIFAVSQAGGKLFRIS